MMPRRIATIWDPRYHTDAAPLTSTTKQARVVALAEKAGLISTTCPVEEPLDAICTRVMRVHAPAYVHAVRTGKPYRLAESQGFTWSPAFAEAVIRTWAGHELAVALALQTGEPVLHPVSGAHHAGAARGGGFCTFNYLVGAPRTAGVRVLNVDLDAHYGDGTDRLTKDDPNVTHLDIAAGTECGVVTNAMPRGVWVEVRRWREYWEALQEWLPRLLDTDPELVQYQAGMDVHCLDPLGGITGMSGGQCAQRDRYVFEQVLSRHIPLVVTLAGGYGKRVESLHVQTVRELHEVINARL